MRFLLDTHCWLWMQTTPERFKPETRAALEDPAHELFLSAASSWEIAIKHSLGKLSLPAPTSAYISSRLQSGGVQSLPIEHRHAVHVADLPWHHRDPFDRLIVAQALLDDLTLLTVDRQLAEYPVRIHWG